MAMLELGDKPSWAFDHDLQDWCWYDRTRKVYRTLGGKTLNASRPADHRAARVYPPLEGDNDTSGRSISRSLPKTGDGHSACLDATVNPVVVSTSSNPYSDRSPASSRRSYRARTCPDAQDIQPRVRRRRASRTSSSANATCTLQARRDPSKFFVVGRIFSAPIAEVLDSTAAAIRRGAANENATTSNQQMAHFVVVRAGPSSCGVVPILSYDMVRAINTKHRISELGIIYTGAVVPDSHHAKAGLSSLPVHARTNRRLEAGSCVDYGRVYTIEHSAAVRPFGVVNPDFIHALLVQFIDIYTRAVAVPMTGAKVDEDVIFSLTAESRERMQDIETTSAERDQPSRASDYPKVDSEIVEQNPKTYEDSQLALREMIESAKLSWLHQGYTAQEADPLAETTVRQQLRSLGLGTLPKSMARDRLSAFQLTCQERRSDMERPTTTNDDSPIARLLNRLDRFIELHDRELSHRMQVEQVEDAAWEALAGCLHVIDVAVQDRETIKLEQAHEALNKLYTNLRERHEALMLNARAQLSDLSSTQHAIRHDALLRQWRSSKVKTKETLRQIFAEYEPASRHNSTVDDEPAHLSPELREYYKAMAVVNMLEDRLHEIEIDYDDERTGRNFRLDRGETLSSTEDDFNETFEEQTSKARDELQAAKDALEAAKVLCRVADNALPEDHHAPSEEQRSWPPGADSNVPSRTASSAQLAPSEDGDRHSDVRAWVQDQQDRTAS